ncbi:hypothetical protein QE417_004237 [Mucilaginibacter terrae]|uniref:IS110 family transposase n=1 Tax=Mucilaginibacter terrae TaxID=1955052 RepID=A0ABU3GZH2_9SPHI|nr:hypothetical protein [Mucilaginibacter terrae]
MSSKLQKKKPNAAAKAFRMAAQGVQNSQNWMGHFFRRMKAKGGHKYAVVATARKIAIIYYKMVSERRSFDPLVYEDHLNRNQQAKIASLQKALDRLKQQVA